MGIHGLCIVLVLVAQAHVPERPPGPGKGLQIAVPFTVEGVLLDAAVEGYGAFQGLFVPAGAVQFAQSVDGEGDGIDLLLGVERPASGIQAPEGSAVLPVHEAVHNHAGRPPGDGEMLRPAEQPVCGSEGPEYPGVQDAALLRSGHQLPVAVDAAVEAAGGVLHAIRPERKYVALEFFPDFVDDIVQRFLHILFSFKQI